MFYLNGFNRSAVAFSVAAALTAPTMAQQAPSSELRVIEEITVTAQKRVQSIQDVPVTISAYDGGFLEELGIAELDVLSDFTPGLVTQE